MVHIPAPRSPVKSPMSRSVEWKEYALVHANEIQTSLKLFDVQVLTMRVVCQMHPPNATFTHAYVHVRLLAYAAGSYPIDAARWI